MKSLFESFIDVLRTDDIEKVSAWLMVNSTGGWMETYLIDRGRKSTPITLHAMFHGGAKVRSFVVEKIRLRDVEDISWHKFALARLAAWEPFRGAWEPFHLLDEKIPCVSSSFRLKIENCLLNAGEPRDLERWLPRHEQDDEKLRGLFSLAITGGNLSHLRPLFDYDRAKPDYQFNHQVHACLTMDWVWGQVTGRRMAQMLEGHPDGVVEIFGWMTYSDVLQSFLNLAKISLERPRQELRGMETMVEGLLRPHLSGNPGQDACMDLRRQAMVNQHMRNPQNVYLPQIEVKQLEMWMERVSFSRICRQMTLQGGLSPASRDASVPSL